MKMNTHTVILFAIILFPLQLSGQIVIKENFEGSTKLDWEEHSEKKNSALVQNGYLELKTDNALFPCTTRTYLPIDPDEDFNIKCELFIPHFGNGLYGIMFDMDEDFNKNLVLFNKSTVYCFLYNNGKILEKGDRALIKLPSKEKDCTINLEFIRKGSKCIININNMKAVEIPKKHMSSSLFGFYSSSTLLINSFEVYQEDGQ